MRETPFPAPLSDADADELYAILGRVMADSVRDAAPCTGIAVDRLVASVARDSILSHVARTFLTHNDEGKKPAEAAAHTRAWLTQALIESAQQARRTTTE
ncbi:hypothetical protein [Streptomyces sp. NPDC020681]|uniref:hypothetical protein n=1 Tax=Streptomyces sp. NPDC020681 TaxID=3365083 RepID=UPI0037A1E534